MALFTEYNPIKHWERTYAVNFSDLKAKPGLIWDMSTDERYKHPGSPVLRALPNGFQVMQQEAGAIFLSGTGASMDGDRPFLDKLDLKTLKTERLFRSEKSAFESFAAWYDASAGKFITRRESPQDPPNYFLRTLGGRVQAAAKGEPEWNSSLSPVTRMTDPTPELRGVTKRLVKYKRADGVDLWLHLLYLPPGYQEGTRLPAVMWAYPLDYTDPTMAGQVVGSPHRFTSLGWPLQFFFLLDGYAVIDNPCCRSSATRKKYTTPTWSNWSPAPQRRSTRRSNWAASIEPDRCHRPQPRRDDDRQSACPFRSLPRGHSAQWRL